MVECKEGITSADQKPSNLLETDANSTPGHVRGLIGNLSFTYPLIYKLQIFKRTAQTAGLVSSLWRKWRFVHQIYFEVNQLT
jgi:hypothetical protein